LGKRDEELSRLLYRCGISASLGHWAVSSA
jgi:hypothetical protein